MRQRRWPWLVSALLGLLAATAAGYSTYLAWLPCRGSMLVASALEGFAQTADLSDACLQRMDSYDLMVIPGSPLHRVPGSVEFGLLAGTLVACAWIVIVIGLRCSTRTRVIAALPAVLTLAMVMLGLGELMTGFPLSGVSGLLMWLVDGTVLGVAVQIFWHQADPIRRRSDVVRLLLALWSAAALGFGHFVTSYVLMIGFSEADWDAPPGTGYLTAAAIALSALGILAITLWPRRRPLTTPPVTEELLLIH